MIPFNLTALIREVPFIERKTKTRNIFPRKTLQIFTRHSFIVSILDHISCFNLNLPFSTTALRHFKRKTIAEMNSKFTIDDDQEMETQHIYLIYLSSDESEMDSPRSSPILQLPNIVHDIYSAITQLIEAQDEQMPLSGTSALQYPTTPPTSLISMTRMLKCSPQ